MSRSIRALMAVGTTFAVLAAATPAGAVPPLDGLPDIASPVSEPANGLLCGRGWHWSYFYFKCERNRHRCPDGKHWISLLKVCL
jgi:hypothetical protein